MSKEKSYLTKAEKLSMMTVFIMAILGASRGVYFITNYSTAVHESEFYEKLDQVAPLYVWGVPFLIGGLILAWSSFFIINQNAKKAFDIFLFIGSFILAMSYLLISMASVSNNLNWLTPVNNTILFVFYSGLTWIGLDSLWINRKKKKN